MDHNDRRAIEDLFGKLSQAAQAQPDRDPEAEALIADLVARNPGAAYYLSQTVIMQEQALRAAEQQMEDARHQPAQPGGLFGRMFGGGQPEPARPAAPRPASHQAPAEVQNTGPWGRGRAGGGGFMAGAAQTAMGVAGGVLLGNAIGGMFAGPAEASGFDQDPAMDDDPGFDDAGFDDSGFDE